METAIAHHSESMSLGEAEKLAKVVASSSIVPDTLKGKPNDCLIILLTGKELGLGPMQAIRSIVVIKGKPVMSADLMVALCKRSTECEYFKLVSSDPKAATYETKRQGDPEPTKMSYTLADASNAGLIGNPTWQKHPAAMLRARCASALSRAVYPDLMLGVYEQGEGEEIQARSTSGQVINMPQQDTNLTHLLEQSIEAKPFQNKKAEEQRRAAQNIADAAEALDAETIERPPEASTDVFRMPFDAKNGSFSKGQPITEVDTSDLEGLVPYFRKKAKDPANKYAEKSAKDLAAIQAELERRRTAE